MRRLRPRVEAARPTPTAHLPDLQARELERSANSQNLSPRERASNSMMEINLNSGGDATLHNFSAYLLSDVDGEITVSFPSLGSVHDFLAKLYHWATRSDFVTKTISAHDIDFSEVASRLTMSGSRSLRLVVRRKPVGFQPHPEQAPNMISIYVVETLECGHEQTYHFVEEVEMLTARRRVCRECCGLLQSLPPKKPARSVRLKPAEEVA